MKCFKQLGALALYYFATVALAQEDAVVDEKLPPSDVHALGKDNFKEFISSHPLVLAEFYAPWCGHCKALAPEYEDAATKLKARDIPLVKVDCTVEQDLCKEYEVGGYPTVKVFRGPDNHTPYSGQRKSDAIVSYMTKQSLPAVSFLDKGNFTNFKMEDKVVLIAYMDPEDKENLETYTKVADSMRDTFLFGVVHDPTVAEMDKVKAPAIVLYKSFDEGKVVYDGRMDVEEITDFAKTASVPLVGEVGPETYAGYMAAGIPLAYLFVDNDKSKVELTALVRPLAEKYRGKINFATIDAVAFGAHAGNLNLEVGKWPAFAIQDTVKNLKFPYPQEQELTEATVSKYVEDYAEGKLQPSIKSEPIPETQDGPVYVVVAHNYKDIVIDTDKDVLLEFYAPWCGHCKNLAPKYEELAGLYFNNPEYASKVLVAKVDATANDVPDEIQGFPTIKLFPAGKKDSPVDYQGDRTVEDLANFIRDNGAHKVDAYVPPPPEPEVAEEEEPAPEPPVAESSSEASSSASETTKEEAKPSEPAKKDEVKHEEL